MNTTDSVSDYQEAAWLRIAASIKTAIESDTWERMPTVFIETFHAECQRDADLLIAEDRVAQVFPKLRSRHFEKPAFPQNLAVRLQKLHNEDMGKLLNSFLFKIDREGLEGKVASSVADALAILYSLTPRWQNKDDYYAPKIANALWQMTDCNEVFLFTTHILYGSLLNVRSYYVASRSVQEADEIWSQNSITGQPDLMARMETLSQLVQTEPQEIFRAFVEQRGAVDISVFQDTQPET
jgi:hypothetical protein